MVNINMKGGSCDLFQGTRLLVKMVMNLFALWKAQNFLT